MIQNWIAQKPDFLGLDLFIIGREVMTPDDLLGIDEKGYLAILELKRDRTPRQVIAQVLDYASWVVMLKTSEVNDIAPAKRQLAAMHFRDGPKPAARAAKKVEGSCPPARCNPISMHPGPR